MLQAGISFPFSMLLQATQHCGATDQKNKLFALIGISDPASCQDFHVDYGKDASSVYRNTARDILIEERNLSLLHDTVIGAP